MSSEEARALSKKVPLVIYVDGTRYVIGEAVVRPDGTGEFIITNNEIRTKVGIADGAMSFGFNAGHPSEPGEASIKTRMSPYASARFEFFLNPRKEPAWGPVN